MTLLKKLSREPVPELFLWRILIKLQSNILFILFAGLTVTAVFVNGCAKKEPKKEYVARVNDSYLTSDDIDNMLESGSYSRYHRNELIRNWIRREVLYQAAVRDGMLDDNSYKRIVENSKKELASALMLNKFYDEESFIYEQKDIEEHFKNNSDKFRLFNDSYLINLISFNDEDKAVRFRSTAVESDWGKAINVFKGDSSITDEETGRLSSQYEIHPVLLLRILKELNPQEISIVLSIEPEKFLVVQLVEKYNKGTIPPFEIIKQQVQDKFLAEKKEALLKDYLLELYSDNEIEIK
ncbi:MAG: hypothetical protein R6W90_13450 [Ignavibacteriaceae bacterium]